MILQKFSIYKECVGKWDIALKRMNKFRTLKMELFLLCAVAFIICLFFHAITSTVASELIDSYFSDRQNIEAIEKKSQVATKICYR